MVEIKQYKWPLISIVIIVAVLMLMIAVGFTIGILSEDPDGLERALINANGEEWLESLPSYWDPFLSGIESDYLAGVIGISLSVVFMIAIFYLIAFIKKKKA